MATYIKAFAIWRLITKDKKRDDILILYTSALWCLGVCVNR